MKTTYILLIALLLSVNTFSQENSDLEKTWQVGLTFGEIPILSGSFKPGITLGYYLNKETMLEFTYQLKDYLQRDEESFNAVNIGYEGLLSSKETTGERIFLGMRYKPYKYSPYVTAGMVINMQDVETIKFDKRQRTIGENSYTTDIRVVQKRETGFAPAVGIGYQYDFSNGISVNTSFAMAFFNKVPTPEVEITPGSDVAAEDLQILKDKVVNSYLDNFHNRYHIFNLGVSYRFN